MPNHIVVDGEWIGSIAAAAGIRSWKTLWNHPRNAGLRARRDPNLLIPGDTVWIPPVDVRGESTATAASHKLVVSTPLNKLVIRFTRITRYVNSFGPIHYELAVGSSRQGGELHTDGDQIEAPLPLNATEATLTINGATATLKIGKLQPIARLAGMQARMTNLGWDVGAIDNQDGPRTKQGTKGFQAFYTIKVDGIIGGQTRGKAKQVYGC
jgi:peptidoglycan hydrolase-like protein with peptidoglycan-binding domain